MSLIKIGKEKYRSFAHAFRGIGSLFQEERNARIHFSVLILVLTLGYLVGLTRMEWIAIALSATLVIGMEALNAAIEKLADHVEAEHHRRIGKLKDLSAAAVLIAALGSSVVGASIFLPHIL